MAPGSMTLADLKGRGRGDEAEAAEEVEPAEDNRSAEAVVEAAAGEGANAREKKTTSRARTARFKAAGGASRVRPRAVPGPPVPLDPSSGVPTFDSPFPAPSLLDRHL